MTGAESGEAIVRADGGSSIRFSLSDLHARPEEADVREKFDGVEYSGPHWFVTLEKVDGEGTLYFASGETCVPEENLPDSLSENALEMARDAGLIHNGEWAQRIVDRTNVPDAVYDAVEAKGFTVSHRTDDENEDQDEIDAETWLYDGTCPNCGPELCMERVEGPDICYNCGAEIEEADTDD
jgi:hypothetical protein